MNVFFLICRFLRQIPLTLRLIKTKFLAEIVHNCQKNEKSEFLSKSRENCLKLWKGFQGFGAISGSTKCRDREIAPNEI